MGSNKILQASVNRRLTQDPPASHVDYDNLVFEKLIDKKQLADLLGASVSFIEKKMVLGLPHLKDGKFVRFRYSEVMTWLERRARRS
jgi:excisionase family DNA binding protein